MHEWKSVAFGEVTIREGPLGSFSYTRASGWAFMPSR